MQETFRKQELSRELENALKLALTSQKSSKDAISSDVTQTLCNVVEAIFIHGLRDPFFLKGSRYAKYPEPNFWPFVSKFSHPGLKTQIGALKQIRSEIGKGRAWIRLVLNEQAMEHYLTTLKNESTDIQRFYKEDAYLRDTEHVERMKDYCKGFLTRCVVSAPTNSAFLNTWTPTPLILAGLVDGRPLRVSSLNNSSRCPSYSDVEEALGGSGLGIGAGSGNGNPPHSPISIQRRNGDGWDAEEAAGSLYSHPSLIEGCHDGHPLSSTPISPDLLCSGAGGGGASSFVVQRRATRPRKLSKSSSHSSGGLAMSAPGTDLIGSFPSSLPIYLSSPPCGGGEGSLPALPYHTADSGIDDVRDCSVSAVSACTSDAGDQNASVSSEADLKDELEVSAISGISASQETDEEVFHENKSPDEGVDDTGQEVSIAEEMEAASVDMASSLQSVPSSGNSLAGRSWALSNSSMNDAPPIVVIQSMPTVPPNISQTQPLSPCQEAVQQVDARNEKDAEKAEAETVASLVKIPQEKGLPQQNFECAACRRNIGAGFGRWRVCGMDGGYYCADCFSSQLRPIPSRILFNWDHRPRAVSAKGKAFFDSVCDRPLLRIDQHNPKLYEQVPALSLVKKIRERLQNASMYLLSCRDSVTEDLKRRLWPANYLLDNLHVYSVQDLLNVQNGTLERHLNHVLSFAVNHVMNCPLCRQKGFVCELCNKGDVIYPFEQDRIRCDVCFSLFHSPCYDAHGACPKCQRRHAVSDIVNNEVKMGTSPLQRQKTPSSEVASSLEERTVSDTSRRKLHTEVGRSSELRH